MRGAEAIIVRIRLIKRDCIKKSRIAKNYRVCELDRKLRMERTRSEARLLNKAKVAGVECPTVFVVDDFDIIMEFIEGARSEMSKKECADAGSILARLHAGDIIHGDYTPANLIMSRGRLYVIDFGLGFISNDVEDKAVDVFTMMRALSQKTKKEAFVDGYRAYEKSHAVLERVKNVEKRVRYAQ